MGKIFSAIDNQIIRPRTIASEEDGFKIAKEDIGSFYSQGKPKIYERTNKYGDSPRSSGVTGANGNYDYSIYLEDPDYSTGKFSGHDVLEQAQFNGSGILGKPGTWKESEEDIKEAIVKNFS